MLNPERTNRMTCTVCGWTRIIDHSREYRGGHTPPSNFDGELVPGADDCHGMLTFEEVSPQPPTPDMFEPGWEGEP